MNIGGIANCSACTQQAVEYGDAVTDGIADMDVWSTGEKIDSQAATITSGRILVGTGDGSRETEEQQTGTESDPGSQ